MKMAYMLCLYNSQQLGIRNKQRWHWPVACMMLWCEVYRALKQQQKGLDVAQWYRMLRKASLHQNTMPVCQCSVRLSQLQLCHMLCQSNTAAPNPSSGSSDGYFDQ